jgi:hypothetical protein
MIAAKWYQFAYTQVASAGDPDVLVEIPAGRHLVIFDDAVSRHGNAPECEIGFSGTPGPKARILQSTLIELCKGGHAAFRGDAY